MKTLKILCLCLAAASVINGCQKFTDVATPKNQLTTDKVFADSVSAEAAMANIYALFDRTIDPNYNKWMGLYTDELIFPGSGEAQEEIYHSKVGINNAYVKTIWSDFYFVIYSCNDLVSQLENNHQLTAAQSSSLTGEAKFLRAFSYFYLTNTYGPVPLLLTTGVNTNAVAARTDSAAVYAQIRQDLNDAIASLPEFIQGSRLRAGKYAAQALLARVQLYQKDWADAESTASSLINSGQFPLESPANVFLAGSNESILHFWTQNGYISDASSLIPASGEAPTYPVSNDLLNAFEAGDQRKVNWLNNVTINGTTYYYPYKYHSSPGNVPSPEYLAALRGAEQYLIRAEANAQQGAIAAAIADVDVVRQRAGLGNLPATLNNGQCLNAIYKEWRLEFFTEWGHRFLDLKHSGQLNSVMTAYKPAWKQAAALFPIPESEITYDPNLEQNPGY